MRTESTCIGCIAFNGNKCCAEKCGGKFTRIGPTNHLSDELRRKGYQIVVDTFDVCFGDDRDSDVLEGRNK